MASHFTSLNAHNGCRALFNHTAGWAYFGAGGVIDPTAPGTVSYTYKRYPRDAAPRDAAPREATSPRNTKPGETLSRKTNEVLSAYLDGADLSPLLAEGENFEARAGGNEETDSNGNDHLRPRIGLPIVLTLQAILSGAPSTPNTASCAGVSNDVESGDADGPPRVSDHAHFPPLRSPELFLAAPIVVKPEAGGINGGISCSEALVAAAVATAEAGSVVGDGGQVTRKEVSRVGWWLRWVTVGNVDDKTAAAAVADASLEMRGGLEGWQVVSVGEDTGAGSGTEDKVSSSWCNVDACGMVTNEDMASYTASNVPPRRSFRDMLMASTPTLGTGFSSCQAFSRPGRGGAARAPRLVDGPDGTGAYLWKTAAAGKGRNKADDGGMGDEDPYYARKRLGAFAFKTKPRGKAHK